MGLKIGLCQATLEPAHNESELAWEEVAAMGLRINTNLGSIAAQRQIAITTRKSQTAMSQLASGSRFSDLTEGAADFAIAEHLRGQIRGMEAARMNAQNATSFVQIAEGGLNEQNNILIRQRELAVQSASDTFSDTERSMIDDEFQQLSQEFDRIAKTTQFGSHKLLSGEQKEYEFQVGAYGGSENIIKYNADTNTTASSLGVDGLDVADKSGARNSLESIDTALQDIAKARANFGAMQSRLESVDNNAGIQIENLQAAHSRIADTDVAKAVSEMYRNQALQHYQLQVLGIANQFPENVIRLVA
jgi:flagellin